MNLNGNLKQSYSNVLVILLCLYLIVLLKRQDNYAVVFC